MRLRLLFCVLLVLVLLASMANAAVIRVNATSAYDGPGNDWEHAYHSVQIGINAAAQGDEIWVAAGTYKQYITLKAGTGLYGGFSGAETSRDQRDPVANTTTIDANGSYQVVTSLSGAGRDTIIDGFTIRNGSGSGVYCSSSSPTITNNTITGNTGSGVYCLYSNSVISRNRIIGNTGSQGGGIFLRLSPAIITNNNIENNVSDIDSGGGVCSVQSASLVANNRIVGNLAAKDGGGICLIGSLAPLIYNNTLVGNVAADGGGLSIREPLSQVVNNIIAYNSSGVYFAGTGAPTLNHNCVYNPAGYDYSGVPAGIESLSVDPKLTSYLYGETHLEQGSPCIDAGDDSVAQSNWLDIDGLTRIEGDHVDIGADEFDGATWAFTTPVYRVSPTGSDSNDGSSWELAKKSVQSAIDAAAVNGGEVWVKAGVYNERITLKQFTFVYGGFSGSETTREERDWSRRQTVLDGGAAGTVVTASDIPLGRATVDGFIIRNGKTSSGKGGGIYCSKAGIAIVSNVISDNTAFTGGAIYCDTSAAVISNNVISYNTNTYTESGYNGVVQLVSSPAKVVNNTIVANTAPNGGAIYSVNSAAAISNNIIAFNSSGIYSSGTPTPTLRNNDLYNPGGANYTGLPAGEGDIPGDPQFAGWQYRYVSIQPTSRCKDAGWNDAPGMSATDIAGKPRVQPQNGTVDIGAYESDGNPVAPVPMVVYVDASRGDDANDGSSWELAKKSVQAALDSAAATGGEVRVKAGTYHERIALRQFVYLYGGFAGTETTRSERSIAANRTILDGGGAGRVVSAISIATGFACIDGFVITNGLGTWLAEGGGIGCIGSPISILNNAIVGNNGYMRGGGILLAGSAAIVANNTIKDNTTRTFSGEGISCYSSEAKIINNTIIGNIGFEAGAIECESSAATIANNIIAFNWSGIGATGYPLPTLRNNDVHNPYGLVDYSGIPAGEGDISVDPKFTAGQFGDPHIDPNSPCRNAGWAEAPGLPATDIDGQSRLSATDAKVDIGADESDGNVWAFTPAIVRVDGANGSDLSDGSSWSSAMKTVQAATNRASALGGEVWVKAGVYKETLALQAFAFLYGGFAGNESSRDARDWKANPSVLDGGALGSVVCAYDIGPGMGAIDGFTITNGKSPDIGGGIVCSCFGGAIHNNVITANSAADGGGIGFGALSSPEIVGNIISGNTAKYGAAIYCFCPAVISNNTIVGNTATVSAGGTIDCDSAAGVISNNLIAFNSSGIRATGTLPVLRNNNVYNPGGVNYCGISPDGASISRDPLLSNRKAQDYHITGHSPCIDAGVAADGLGTVDIDGETRVYGNAVDIGADEFAGRALDLRSAKGMADGTSVSSYHAAVSAAFPGFFYVESDDRSSGMRVEMPAHGLSEGMRADFSGAMATNADGERCIAATSVSAKGSSWILPLALNNASLGGGSQGLQEAVFGWMIVESESQQMQRRWTRASGLNNIGLLVRTSGKVLSELTTPNSFTIDDGSDVRVRCVVPDGVAIDLAWTYVSVTGVSSCERVGEELHRVLRIRAQDDITSISGG